MADYDDSDVCKRCGELHDILEIKHFREECNGADDDGMPTYCQTCLDQLHLLDGTVLHVEDELWTKEQWWLPSAA